MAIAAALAGAAAILAGTDDANCRAAIAYSSDRAGIAVLVLKNGRPICEGYAPGVQPDQRQDVQSASKALVGMIAAAAVQDHLLRLDEPISATLAAWRGDPDGSSATIRQALNLTIGLPTRQGGRPPTYAEATSLPIVGPPGSRFAYGPGPYQLFGAVLQQKLAAAGRPADIEAYARERLFDPIGVKVSWFRQPSGDVLLPSGAAMSARDLARLGELVRAGGVWRGRQLVDPQAFRELFRGSKANPGFGLGWWLPHASRTDDPVARARDIGANAARLSKDLVMAAGVGDQRLYVIPSKHLTIVRYAASGTRPAAGAQAPSSPSWSDTAFLAFFDRR